LTDGAPFGCDAEETEDGGRAMRCQNHPDAGAAGTCSGCAEPFCSRCLVAVRGATYCAACKSMAVTGVTTQSVAICQEAKTALGLAFLGVFAGWCFFGLVGIALGGVAMWKASNARRQIAANPALGGSGWAHAATAVGATVFALSVAILVIYGRNQH
jgi:hypothetical protein